MINKIIVLPSGTPKDIVETWHTVCEKIVKDEKFIKDKALQIGDYDIPLREDAKENLMNGIAMDDESRAWMRNFLLEKYGVKLD
jgi:exonuclease III